VVYYTNECRPTSADQRVQTNEYQEVIFY